MTKRNSTIAIVLGASVLALQAPIAGAAGEAASSADTRGVPGVEMNVGDSASDRGLPGVEANIGRQGDQDNIDQRTLGAGADTRLDADRNNATLGAGADARMDTERSRTAPMRADRG